VKKIFNPFIRTFVSTKAGWVISKFFLRSAEWLRFEKSKLEIQEADQKLRDTFKNLTVKYGYFKGLKYPAFVSFGSSLFPKLSGSYESELFDFFKLTEKNNYDSILDIGCAEGFYAAGLALKFPDTKVYAFDIDERAQKLCYDLCLLNGVAHQVEIKGECTATTLQTLCSGARNLIISDCEGFEKKLFSQINIDSFSNADLLIELHPMYEKDIKEYLSSLFIKTHEINYISSYDDHRKLFDLSPEFQKLSQREKLLLVQEGRAFSMDWMIAISKTGK
jgi:SAM-dependent methyltransferase